MKKVNLFLPERQIAALHVIADESGLGFAEVVRRLLDNALEQEALRQQRLRQARVGTQTQQRSGCISPDEESQ